MKLAISTTTRPLSPHGPEPGAAEPGCQSRPWARGKARSVSCARRQGGAGLHLTNQPIRSGAKCLQITAFGADWGWGRASRSRQTAARIRCAAVCEREVVGGLWPRVPRRDVNTVFASPQRGLAGVSALCKAIDSPPTNRGLSSALHSQNLVAERLDRFSRQTQSHYHQGWARQSPTTKWTEARGGERLEQRNQTSQSSLTGSPHSS